MNTEITRLVLPLGVDPHTHQREGRMSVVSLEHTIRVFPDFLPMPNTVKRRVVFGEEAVEYGEWLKAIAKRSNLPCRPLLTIKYDPVLTTPEVIKRAKELGVGQIKFYPDGVTTNSTGGVRDFKATYPILEAAEECGMKVLWHGEHPDKEIMVREIAFTKFFKEAVRDFPQLKQTMEHLSTWQAVHCIKDIARENIGATITAHHLHMTLTDMAGGLFKVHWMCKPILKNAKDRKALLLAATGDDPWFFFGSDSAEHAVSKKHCAEVCSGVFTAPFALPLVAEIFERLGKLDKLADFVSIRGRKFYNLPETDEKIVLIKDPWIAPDSYGVGYNTIISPVAGERFEWRVE